jgi:hypothetical protein
MECLPYLYQATMFTKVPKLFLAIVVDGAALKMYKPDNISVNVHSNLPSKDSYINTMYLDNI